MVTLLLHSSGSEKVALDNVRVQHAEEENAVFKVGNVLQEISETESGPQCGTFQPIRCGDGGVLYCIILKGYRFRTKILQGVQRTASSRFCSVLLYCFKCCLCRQQERECRSFLSTELRS